MKVLVICVQFPYPPRSGVNMRVYQLLTQLAARHDVTLLSYALPEELERVHALRKQLPVRVVQRQPVSRAAKRAAQLRSLVSAQPFATREVLSPEMQNAINELCAAESFDVIQLEGSLLCGFTFPPGVRLVLDEHNIEYEVFRRMCDGERSVARRWFNRIEHRRFRRLEQRAWTQVDGCVVTSPREEPVVQAIAPRTPTAVVSNGVDTEFFSPGDEPEESRTVVFNGTLAYRPNVDAVHHLIDDVWPLVLERCPDAVLKIVGRADPSEVRRFTRPGVIVTGEVPDVRPYLHSATVVAVPIRIGGGTRLKVVEGLSMGKAMVSTSLGSEGIAVVDREHLLIADDARSFADAILELFDTEATRRALGGAGRRLAVEQYTWGLAGEGLEQLHQQIVETAGLSAAATPLAQA
jgi:sugar transferase (PEP-CTERM/EpsH1 system associated)